jgi:hypothetical protein
MYSIFGTDRAAKQVANVPTEGLHHICPRHVVRHSDAARDIRQPWERGSGQNKQPGTDISAQGGLNHPGWLSCPICRFKFRSEFRCSACNPNLGVWTSLMQQSTGEMNRTLSPDFLVNPRISDSGLAAESSYTAANWSSGLKTETRIRGIASGMKKRNHPRIPDFLDCYCQQLRTTTQLRRPPS